MQLFLFRKSNLKAHRESLHFGKKFPCRVCGRVFTNRSSMNQHVKKSHLRQILILSLYPGEGVALKSNKREVVGVTYFETKTKSHGNSTKKRFTYSTEIWHDSCFNDFLYGTVKKRWLNRTAVFRRTFLCLFSPN